MNIKKKQKELLSKIQGIIEAYEGNEIADREESAENRVKQMIEDYVNLYLTER